MPTVVPGLCSANRKCDKNCTQLPFEFAMHKNVTVLAMHLSTVNEEVEKLLLCSYADDEREMADIAVKSSAKRRRF
jgi:hypothetical protein